MLLYLIIHFTFHIYKKCMMIFLLLESLDQQPIFEYLHLCNKLQSPASQPASQPARASHPASQPASQPVSQSSNQPASQQARQT